jgi:putative PEP-CTERM system histidine kinase
MFLLGFLLCSTGLNLVLGFMVQFKNYRLSMRAVLLGLAALFTAHLWVAYSAVFASTPDSWFLLIKILLALELLESLGLLEVTRQFLRDGEDPNSFALGPARMSIFILACAGTALAGIILFLPDQVVRGSQAAPLGEVHFNGLGVLIPTVRVLVAIYSLYLLENTYRFAQDYQRRIGRLCFIGLAAMAIFGIFHYSGSLLYRTLPEHFAEGSSVICGIVYPVVLGGFLRYRLGIERISIPRDTVYTSATVFLTGAAFLGVALTVFVFRWFDLDFNYFERYLAAFSLCFLTLLVLGSGTMRRRISAFVNQQLYSRKYDYQDQFFRLHKTMMSGSDVETALTELVENMKYTVNVSDAYVFVLNWQDGNFHQHENKEEATRRGLLIRGDSPLVRLLTATGSPVDLVGNSGDAEARMKARSEPVVLEEKFDAIFPVFISEGLRGSRLVGLLALQGGRSAPFDSEDLELIAVFTNSIGNALFRNRVLSERIEQKQFESFNHVASFIIHDIKNQVATLSLVLKNAERNLGNPSFQASMMTSIKSCAGALQNLIDKLAVGPKRQQELALSRQPLRPVLDEVIANAGLAALPEIAFTFRGEGDVPARLDRQAFFFVVRNLVNNALEAMGGHGSITLCYGSLADGTPEVLREHFGGEQLLSGYGSYVLVKDSGVGMDREFLRRRLFQPFATTKEKGVGIGLYQCKTLMERMGGAILVHSERGHGTEFCLLLNAGTA